MVSLIKVLIGVRGKIASIHKLSWSRKVLYQQVLAIGVLFVFNFHAQKGYNTRERYCMVLDHMSHKLVFNRKASIGHKGIDRLHMC